MTEQSKFTQFNPNEFDYKKYVLDESIQKSIDLLEKFKSNITLNEDKNIIEYLIISIDILKTRLLELNSYPLINKYKIDVMKTEYIMNEKIIIYILVDDLIINFTLILKTDKLIVDLNFIEGRHEHLPTEFNEFDRTVEMIMWEKIFNLIDYVKRVKKDHSFYKSYLPKFKS